MLRRLAQHFVGVQLGTEKKYRILDELRRNGHSVHFEVLYFATEQNYDAIVEEIGMKEGEFIRQYRPILNTQIPNENDWRKYENQSVDARKILEDML